MSNTILADAILQFISCKKIGLLLDISDEFTIKRLYKSIEVKVAIAELLEYGFIILMQNRQRSVILSDKGRKAVKIGIVECEKCELKTKNRDKKTSYKLNLIISISSSIIGAIIGAIITMLLSQK